MKKNIKTKRYRKENLNEININLKEGFNLKMFYL